MTCAALARLRPRGTSGQRPSTSYPTYTAMLEIRRVLASLGAVERLLAAMTELQVTGSQVAGWGPGGMWPRIAIRAWARQAATKSAPQTACCQAMCANLDRTPGPNLQLITCQPVTAFTTARRRRAFRGWSGLPGGGRRCARSRRSIFSMPCMTVRVVAAAQRLADVRQRAVGLLAHDVHRHLARARRCPWCAPCRCRSFSGTL